MIYTFLNGKLFIIWDGNKDEVTKLIAKLNLVQLFFIYLSCIFNGKSKIKILKITWELCPFKIAFRVFEELSGHEWVIFLTFYWLTICRNQSNVGKIDPFTPQKFDSCKKF